jgi:hypothetical protein
MSDSADLRREFERLEREARRLTGWPPAYPPNYLDPQIPWDYARIAGDACRKS